MKIGLIITSRGKLVDVETRPIKILVNGVVDVKLFRVREIIGMAVVNPRGCARGKKSVVIGK